MPDIREVLAALDDADRTLWTKHRTEMRKSYMNAHNNVIGLNSWDYNDDAFLDLIDIKLALLFDKSGRLTADRTIVSNEDGEKIEDGIQQLAKMIKPNTAPNGWENKQNGK